MHQKNSSSIFIPAILYLFVSTLSVQAQRKINPPAPVLPVPTDKQLRWHNMEMNAFVHFSMNSFTDKEWGYGDESPSLFNPDSLNADQWAITLKDAGFQGLIFTAKHHDGFCLWPSPYTDHSVKSSPWKNGHGDVVKEISEACHKNNLKFGIYLSPWDRHESSYSRPEYIQYYRRQLKELFTNYGPVFEMWFDGANGGDGYYGGSREIRRINKEVYYDWPATLKMVRQLQPNVLFFSDAGPDMRWSGNEEGEAGVTNWNTISADTLYAGKSGIEDLLNRGSEEGKNWIPQEADVSIRPGWFYHSAEDSLVKSPQQLFDIYLTSVGRGSTLLLNVPPDNHGLIHDNDVKSLQGFKKLVDAAFKKNLAKGARIRASNSRGGSVVYGASRLTDGRSDTYWATDDSVHTAEIDITFVKEEKVKYILLQEYIQLGQRVKSFSADVWKNGQWMQAGEGTTIGHKRILAIDPTSTSRVRVRILQSKACPVLSEIGLY
jgi:alpha-L-fucosidase